MQKHTKYLNNKPTKQLTNELTLEKGNCEVVDNVHIQRIVVGNSPDRRRFLLIDNI